MSKDLAFGSIHHDQKKLVGAKKIEGLSEIDNLREPCGRCESLDSPVAVVI
jgi:hypothetical protein